MEGEDFSVLLGLLCSTIDTIKRLNTGIVRWIHTWERKIKAFCSSKVSFHVHFWQEMLSKELIRSLWRFTNKNNFPSIRFEKVPQFFQEILIQFWHWLGIYRLTGYEFWFWINLIFFYVSDGSFKEVSKPFRQFLNLSFCRKSHLRMNLFRSVSLSEFKGLVHITSSRIFQESVS